MNDSDRQQIGRVYDLVRIPLPAGFSSGSVSSASIYGAVAFSHDMARLQPLLSRAICGILHRGHEGWEDQVEDGEEALVEAEAFFAARQAEGWCNYSERKSHG